MVGQQVAKRGRGGRGGGGRGGGGRGRGAGVQKGGRGGRTGRGGGRGGGRGRGRRDDRGKKVTAEDLDAEMDKYFMKDAKTAASKLDNDLDEYFTKKSEKKVEEEIEEGAIAEDAEPVAEAEG